MLKILGIFVGIVAVLYGATFLMQEKAKEITVTDTPQASMENPVEVIDGKQVIQIKAKGGYSPMKVTAKAGMPTTLRVTTKGTFDCSASIRVPSMDISEALPPTGQTDIDLGTPESGKLAGTCGMGMYPFEIDFQS